jgi:hypothetical protein
MRPRRCGPGNSSRVEAKRGRRSPRSCRVCRARSAGLDGRVVVLLLDDLGIAPEAVWRTKDIASGFAARMRSPDLITVVRLNDGTYSTTSDAGAVRSLIDDFRLIGEPMRRPVGHLSGLAVDTIDERVAVVSHVLP